MSENEKKGVGIGPKLLKGGAWIIRPSFTKDNWNPGKGSTDMLKYTKTPKGMEPLKYEDICKAYDYSVDENNVADITRIKSRRNMFALVLCIHSFIIIMLSNKREPVFDYWILDFILFFIPVITLFIATIIMDFFLEVAKCRRSISFFEYLKIKGGIGGR